MSVYSFITQPFRFSEQFDNTVRANYQLARVVEVLGKQQVMADANATSAILFGILKAQRQRFSVTVLGVNVVNLSMFDGTPPAAMLVSDRFGLTAGKLVMIPDFSVDYSKGITTLRCWG